MNIIPETEIVELKSNDQVKILDGIILHVTDIVFEEIAACPAEDGDDGENAYPAGSGVVISFNVINGNETVELFLSELTEPYASQEMVDWNGYRFKLAGLDGYNDPIVSISVGVCD